MKQTYTQRLNSLLSDLRYELAPGVHTYHYCPCGWSTRRGRCAVCLVGDFVEEIFFEGKKE